VPSAAVAVTGDPGVVGVLGPFGVPLDGAATADGSAGGSVLPPHAESAAREPKRVTVMTAFRITPG